MVGGLLCNVTWSPFDYARSVRGGCVFLECEVRVVGGRIEEKVRRCFEQIAVQPSALTSPVTSQVQMLSPSSACDADQDAQSVSARTSIRFPESNPMLFDVLQEHGIVQPTTDGKRLCVGLRASTQARRAATFACGMALMLACFLFDDDCSPVLPGSQSPLSA